jgi:hypothetical protein
MMSALLAIAGLILMFSSISFAVSLADSWLLDQENGMADTNRYNMMMETYKHNFVIVGSILFGGGLLTAILTYFTSLLFAKEKREDMA